MKCAKCISCISVEFIRIVFPFWTNVSYSTAFGGCVKKLKRWSNSFAVSIFLVHQKYLMLLLPAVAEPEPTSHFQKRDAWSTIKFIATINGIFLEPLIYSKLCNVHFKGVTLAIYFPVNGKYLSYIAFVSYFIRQTTFHRLRIWNEKRKMFIIISRRHHLPRSVIVVENRRDQNELSSYRTISQRWQFYNFLHFFRLKKYVQTIEWFIKIINMKQCVTSWYEMSLYVFIFNQHTSLSVLHGMVIENTPLEVHEKNPSCARRESFPEAH